MKWDDFIEWLRRRALGGGKSRTKAHAGQKRGKVARRRRLRKIQNDSRKRNRKVV
jgi:hypothetical protein